MILFMYLSNRRCQRPLKCWKAYWEKHWLVPKIDRIHHCHSNFSPKYHESQVIEGDMFCLYPCTSVSIYLFRKLKVLYRWSSNISDVTSHPNDRIIDEFRNRFHMRHHRLVSLNRIRSSISRMRRTTLAMTMRSYAISILNKTNPCQLLTLTTSSMNKSNTFDTHVHQYIICS